MKNKLYVDNLLHTTNDSNFGQTIKNLHESCIQGGFELREWSSNNKRLVEHLPAEASLLNLERL